MVAAVVEILVSVPLKNRNPVEIIQRGKALLAVSNNKNDRNT